MPLQKISGPWVSEGVCLEHLTRGLCEVLGGTVWGMSVNADISSPKAANLRYLYALLISSVGPGNRELGFAKSRIDTSALGFLLH